MSEPGELDESLSDHELNILQLESSDGESAYFSGENYTASETTASARTSPFPWEEDSALGDDPFDLNAIVFEEGAVNRCAVRSPREEIDYEASEEFNDYDGDEESVENISVSSVLSSETIGWESEGLDSENG